MVQRGDNVAAADVLRVVAEMVQELDLYQHDGYKLPFSEFGVRYRTYIMGKYQLESQEVQVTQSVPLSDQLLRFSDALAEAVKSGHRVVVWRERPTAVSIELPGKNHAIALKARLHFMTLEDYKAATENEHTLKAYRTRKLQETNCYRPDVVFSIDTYKDYDNPKTIPQAPQQLPDFGWALKQLRDGKKVARADWSKEFFLDFDGDNVFLNSENFRDLWKPSMPDILAYDWAVVITKDVHYNITKVNVNTETRAVEEPTS